MKVLITGGNGYIGTNLQSMFGFRDTYDYFDYDVCDITNPRENHEHLWKLGKSGTMKTEILIQNAQYITDLGEYDAVVHLAALSGIAACENDPDIAIQKNILTASNIFELCRYEGIPCIFTSSQAAKNPSSSIYAYTKRTIEMIAEDVNNRNGKIYVFRLCNVYGGYKYLIKKQTAIKQFITRYNEGLKLKIDGDGSQTRDFIHVDDVVNAIYSFLLLLEDNSKILPTIMDIGTGIGTSINEIVSYFPDDVEIEYTNNRTVGTDSSIANTEKFESVFGYTIPNRVKDYIEEEIKLFSKRSSRKNTFKLLGESYAEMENRQDSSFMQTNKRRTLIKKKLGLKKESRRNFNTYS